VCGADHNVLGGDYDDLCYIFLFRMITNVVICVPAFNEQGCLWRLHRELVEVLVAYRRIRDISIKLVFVDDGSSDLTWHQIDHLARQFDYISGVRLSRNFGHQIALLAGFEQAVASADCIITMDADLQHPPSTIPSMLDLYIDQNIDVVIAKRESRRGESIVKKVLSSFYYKLLYALGSSLQGEASDFRLISKRAATALISYQDQAFFPRGLVPLIGFRQEVITYNVAARTHGVSKYSAKRMLGLALDGIGATSIRPLRLALVAALLVLLGCVIMIGYTLWVVVGGKAVPGWASIVIPIYALFGVQFLILAIFGEYLGRTYNQALGRPRYIISDRVGDG
jgi:glycosyltransferase involved in cell wall biosynthesis